jgi:pantoate--beta-alanine ligase
MIIFHHINDLKAFAQRNEAKMPHSGFVPTMGALHAGHISLIEESKRKTSLTLASIFVNPTQFNDPKDFEKYPVTIDQDIRMLEEAGCDVLFLPDVHEMYPEGTQTGEVYDLGSLETMWEGKYRPGHFQGVCRVVHKLLNAVEPANLFMGQKDFQQCMVVQKLIDLKKLPVTLHTCPTLRESDGLAMSSRNLRLNSEERQVATAIFKELNRMKEQFGNAPVRKLEEAAALGILNAGFTKVDYISIVTPETLLPLSDEALFGPAVVLAAAYLGEVRLIDNMAV